MKRTSALVLAIGTAALLLAGCGGSSNDAADANGLRKGSSATSTTSAAAKPSTSAAASSTGTPPASKSDTGASGAASKTTCAEFKTLDTNAEKALIEQILAENPDSKFAGSPNVALGTAKLVCLSGSAANTSVAVAVGILPKDK
ncbi:hypothetical protein [Nocardia altamirensis]|uniref:hypothetical protein n=1 Tax=Nocardia altamirensis TaxID=472158 RepID=UPI0008408CA2|nr:hypothetical protein [Nocardia altamirensis]